MAGLNQSDTDIPQPIAVPSTDVDLDHVTHPLKSPAVWVRVHVDDGTERSEQGFALAWTQQHVLVQVLWPQSYYKAAREFWVDAKSVRRRVIQPQWLGRESAV